MKRRKVYNVYQVNLIVIGVLGLMFVPVFLVISYIFDIHQHIKETTILIVSGVSALLFIGASMLSLYLRRDYLSRRLKPNYQREFTLVMSISGIGVLGAGVLFLYLGGQKLYVPHVIIPLGITVFSALYWLGDRYFNISLIRNNKH